MKKLTGLTDPVLNLANMPVRDESGTNVTPASIIANSLCRVISSQPARAVELARTLITLNSDGEMEMEDADYATALKAIEDDALLTNLGKAAALKALE